MKNSTPSKPAAGDSAFGDCYFKDKTLLPGRGHAWDAHDHAVLTLVVHGRLDETFGQQEQRCPVWGLHYKPRGAVHTTSTGPQGVRMVAIYSSLGEREDVEGELLRRGLPVLQGDLTHLGRFALGNRRENRGLVMSLSMDCASGVTPPRKALIQEQAPTALLGNSNLWLEATCPSWPAADLGDDFRSTLRADVPVLFISGSLDVKTPPENAEEILQGFPNGRHLVIEGGSHDDDLFLSSPQIAEAMLTFLRGGEPPRRIELKPLRFKLP
jgi:hypothetical protein